MELANSTEYVALKNPLWYFATYQSSFCGCGAIWISNAFFTLYLLVAGTGGNRMRHGPVAVGHVKETGGDDLVDWRRRGAVLETTKTGLSCSVAARKASVEPRPQRPVSGSSGKSTTSSARLTIHRVRRRSAAAGLSPSGTTTDAKSPRETLDRTRSANAQATKVDSLHSRALGERETEAGVYAGGAAYQK